MERYYTTIEQSMHLLDLGLNPKTCNKSYWLDEQKQWQLKDEQDVAITHDLFSFRNHYVYPCWSVGALIDLIPKTIVLNKKEYSMCLQTLTHCYSLCHTDGRFLNTLGCQIISKNLIDVVYQYVIWLMESGYIHGNKPNN